VVNGRLVEGHHASAAKRLLAMADMIEKLEAGEGARPLAGYFSRF
jgi:hypothetical protein